jgi:hypothetical protein
MQSSPAAISSLFLCSQAPVLAGRAEAFAHDLTKEPDHILALYGCGRGGRTSYAAQCLAARRLVERNWDSAHHDMAQHAHYAKRVDQPIAGLLFDLKQRDLLRDTLLVFCTEFGRTPWARGGKGTSNRNYHRSALSVWLAGGAVKCGSAYDRYAGRDFHLTDVDGQVVRGLLA